MTKDVSQLEPNYAPVYAAALYPELAGIFQKYGYALAVHGSLRRDFDLIAVPWAEQVTPPEEVLQHITKHFLIRKVGEAEKKRYGRVAYALVVGFGECQIDLSFFPKVQEEKIDANI